MIHPLGPRPLSFFGLENGYEDEDWRVTEYRIQEDQRRWDAMYRALPWVTRLRCRLAGEVTEPVGTSAGGFLSEAYWDMTCSVCGGSVSYCGCGSGCEHYRCNNPACAATEAQILGY